MTEKKFITTFIEEKLNSHALYKFSLSEDVDDITSYFEDGAKREVFLGILTDYAGEHIPIAGANASNESGIFYLQVPTKYATEVINFINTTVSSEVVGACPAEYVDAYRIFSMSIASVAETQIYNGVSYAIISFQVFMKKSVSFIPGNFVLTAINGENVISCDDGRLINQTVQATSTHAIDEATGGAIPNENVVTFKISVYLENKDVLKQILHDITNGIQGNLYTCVFTFPFINSSIDITYRAILTSGTVIFDYGDWIKLSCDFAVASSLITSPDNPIEEEVN